MDKPEIVKMSKLPKKKEEKTRVIVMDRKLKRKVRPGEEEDIEAIAQEEGVLELDVEAPSGDPGGPGLGGPTITGGALASAIATDFGPTCAGGGIYLSDGKYFLYPDSHIKKVLSEDLTDLQFWISEYFDCDDFAQVVAGVVNQQLKGAPFGILWFKGSGIYHAINCFYSKDKGKMLVVEPQTDHVFTFDRNKYCPMLVVI